MTVTVLGVALRQIIPKIIGQNLTSWFELVKPLVEFKWDVSISIIFLSFISLKIVKKANNNSNQFMLFKASGITLIAPIPFFADILQIFSFTKINNVIFVREDVYISSTCLKPRI